MDKIKRHYMPKYFLQPTHPITICVIGCGGTGSLVIPRLARMDYALKKLGHPGLHVTAYDSDIVDENNPGRQNFTENDIGDFKASNLIEKANYAYSLEWQCFNHNFSPNQIPEFNIVVSCVDNAKFRVDFHKKIRSIKTTFSGAASYKTPLYWIDCGNGKDFGQVIVSTIPKIEQPEKSAFETIKELPSVIDLYPEILKQDNKETQGIEGCSMAESLNNQDLFINDRIAVEACETINKMLRFFYLSFNGTIINQARLVSAPIKLPDEKKKRFKSKAS